ncbi:MAG: hypothetical protein U0457_19250 [Candidatus Sericytochromatia bacterium]
MKYEKIYKAIDTKNFNEFIIIVKMYLDKYKNTIVYDDILDILIRYSKVDIKMIDFILNNGANPNFMLDKEGLNPLIISMGIDFYNYKEYIIETIDTKKLELLVKYGADVNKSTNRGWTPLDEAVAMENHLAEDYLKSLGAKHSKVFLFSDLYTHFKKNLDIENEEYIDTFISDDFIELPILHNEIRRTASDNCDRFFTKNIKDGADVNELDYKNRTPLDYAIEKNHFIAQEILRENGGKLSSEL